ncbi:MAG: hypothetical protein ACRDIU_02505 [Actinomycetota bacterium]
MPEEPADAKQPSRGFVFHWVANIFFASVALLGLIIFGERIPRDMFGLVFTAVVAIALVMVPLTMSWEKAGNERRRRAATARIDSGGKDGAKPHEPEKRDPQEGEE